MVVTPGAKPIMFYTIMALVEPGDEVIYPNPGFPIYESMINFLGGVAVPVATERAARLPHQPRRAGEQGLVQDPPDHHQLASQPHRRRAHRRATSKAIARLAVKHDIVVLADEIYSEIVYEGEHHTILSFPGMMERTILLDGFSKTFAMTGWRLGYGIFPGELIPAHQPPDHQQRLLHLHFQPAGRRRRPHRPARRGRPHAQAAFARRRDLVYEGLNKIPGLRCNKPEGAFYAFPNITDTGMDSRTYADYLLNEADVAVLPGTSFGEFGEGYIRISFANSEANLAEAMRRIESRQPEAARGGSRRARPDPERSEG